MMKSRYRLIGKFKRVDACFQVLCLLFLLGARTAAPEAVAVSILLAAGYFLLSALFWLFALRKEPNIVAGSPAVRMLMLVGSSCLLFVYVLHRLPDRFSSLTMLLYFCGVFTVIYLLMTMLEIRYYKKTAR